MTSELESYKKRCLELEKKSENDEKRCLMLEVEVEDLKNKNKEFEGKIMKIREVVEARDGEDEVEKFYELMTEMKVLECEKQKAESEVSKLKEKVNELESDMKEKAKQDVNVVSMFSSKVRKRLPFEDDGCSSKKMAPSKNKQDTIGVDQNKTVSLQGNSYEEDLDDFPSAKRIRTSNIIRSDDENSNIHDDMDGFKVCSSNSLSDDETSYDDNAPISTLMTRPNTRIKTDSEDDVKENANKQRRKRLRKIGSRNKQDKSDFDLTSSNEEHKHNGGVEEELDSEHDSLGGFIVLSSESGSDSACGSSDVGDEQDDESSDLQVVIEMLGRKKVWNRKWNLEGDMLADFGKDPELCMRAVCALKRQKSIDEDAPEEMRYEEMRNQKGRGFNLYDAPRGAKLAQFLTDGDYDGDLKKTVEELEQHDPNGIEVCTKFAYRYSKQLFRIYQNKEDPYFPSSSSQ